MFEGAPGAAPPPVGEDGGLGPEVVQSDVTDERYPAERRFASATCTVHRAAWVPCWPAWYQPPHTRPWYALYLCAGGGADYEVGGAAVRLAPGEALLLPPQVVRTGRHDPHDPFRLYAVHFSARLYGVLDLPAACGLPLHHRPSPEVMAELLGLARRIVTELQLARPGCVLAAGGYATALLATLVRSTAPPGAGAALHPEGELARLVPVFRLIEREYPRRLTLEQLADEVHLHPAYFSALFRRLTGLPPVQYVARYRLNRVRELLLSTGRTVKEIAAETGYRDHSYLDRVFRRSEGCSPGEYRRAKRSPLLP